VIALTDEVNGSLVRRPMHRSKKQDVKKAELQKVRRPPFSTPPASLLVSALTTAQSLSRPHRPQQGIVIRAAVASPIKDSSLEVIMGESAKATLKASLERLQALMQLPSQG
jgi:hypothetical protein